MYIFMMIYGILKVIYGLVYKEMYFMMVMLLRLLNLYKEIIMGQLILMEMLRYVEIYKDLRN